MTRQRRSGANFPALLGRGAFETQGKQGRDHDTRQNDDETRDGNEDVIRWRHQHVAKDRSARERRGGVVGDCLNHCILPVTQFTSVGAGIPASRLLIE